MQDTAKTASDKPAGVATSGAAFLRIRNLFKSFGKFTALQDISLDVAQGEFICFLGPSGCGKTTLLRAIAGLDQQDRGIIEIAGRDVSQAPPAARDFGIVFQSYALFPNLTVFDNVAYGLVNERWKKADIAARVAELLSIVGLTEQGGKYPTQLSGGQQQRVALARALATSPSLLLLDEPLSALDARVRVRLRDEIKELQRRLRVTTIMVTHDQEEALSMADRIVVMNQGRIDQIGTPYEIYSEPASGFVADFVGTMNFMDAASAGTGKVSIGGLELQLDRPAPAGKVRIGLRPEAVQVQNIAADAPNRFRARIDTLAFLGSFSRVTLVPESAPSLRLLADLSMQDAHAIGAKIGTALDVMIPPEALSVFPAADGMRA